MNAARAAILVIAIAATAYGQGASSAIVGTVTSKGKPLVRARVTIDSAVLQNVRITTTTTRGTYWTGVLPPGTYNVTFSHAGMQTMTRKTEVRLGQTTRLDAELEPSTEGEEVTTTMIVRSVLERPQIDTSLGSAEINDLPIARELTARETLAPGVLGGAIRRSAANIFIVDGVEQRIRGGNVEVEEAIDHAVAIQTPISPEYGRFSGGVVVATTRTGGNDLDGSMRDTITSERWIVGGQPQGSSLHSKGEAVLGGRIIRDALWFFLAGETGSTALGTRERSGMIKLTGSPDSHDTFVATILRAAAPDESRAAIDYTTVPTKNSVIEARIDTSRVESERERHGAIAAHVFIPAHVGGEHTITAGIEEFRGCQLSALTYPRSDAGCPPTADTRHPTAFFAADDWVNGRWVVTAGARRDQDIGTSPRGGVVYDLFPDGRARIAATYARYAATQGDSAREATLVYAQRVFTNGFGRAALVHRDYESGDHYRAFEGELRMIYLLFTIGGTATFAQHGGNTAAAWISATPPALEQHVNASILERYRTGDAATDISLQYRFGRFLVEPFVKVDLMNIFNRTMPALTGEDPVGVHRALRLSVGARL